MMRKMENPRSHSWWWDSHICPKNSKWLQENLSEMDSKVGAMLRIIEEDADSFAQRAEMYYKRRPELINLVEEFYRTYRALVERYTYLTREIRQNFSPAWQAQLGISSESAQNSPVDLHLKKGIDGPDIISPSYSYTGASEFDYDSPTEVSTKGQTDDEFSPLGFQTNFERRPFGFKPRSLHMEESSHRSPDAGLFHGTPEVDLAQLQMELVRLQEENKDLVSKSCEDVAKMKDLQSDLSSLQSKVRVLEAEDKLTKKRLKSVQEKEQKLEAENLKLSHTLMSFKEENSELLEEKKQRMEESSLTAQKIQVLEGETVGLKAELLASHSHWFESKKNLQKKEEAIEELQLTISALEEQKLKDLLVVEFLAQKSEELLTKLFEIEKENAFLTERVSLQEAELHDSQKQLRDASENIQISEKALHATSQEKACIEQEKVLAVSQVENLQKELQRTEREKERLAGDISRLEDTILQLEKEVQRFMSEKMEITQHVSMFEQTIEDKETLIKKLHASCQQYEDRCKDLHIMYEETNAKFIFGSQEVSRLQHKAQTLEDMVSTVKSGNEQLQKEISSLAADKLSLMAKLENMSECALIAECKLTEMHKLVQDKSEEIKMLQEKLVKHINTVNILEEGLSAVSKEKFSLVEEQTESLMVHQQLKDELIMLKDQLEVNTTLKEDKLAQLELEKTKLAHEKQQLQLHLLELQLINSVLLGACEDSKNDLRASEEAAREAQKELKLSLAEVERLHGDKNDKDAVLCSLMRNIEVLEGQIARLNEDNHLLGESTDKYTSSLAALEASNSALNVRLSESVVQNTILAANVSGKEEIIQELTCKLSNAEMQGVSMKQECESTTAQFNNLQQQINSLEQQLGLQHAEFLESSSEERLKAIVEGQQNKLSKSNEVKESLIHEKQILMNDVAALRNMNQDLETNVGQLTREKALLQQEISAHLAQCNDLTQKIASFKTAYEAAQKETAVLKGQLAKSEEENFHRLLEYEGRLRGLRLKLSEMLAAEASLAEQLVERIGSIRSLEMALLDLQRDKLAMNEDLNCLQRQISSFSTREASLRTEMQNSSDLIDALSTEIERLKQKGVAAEESEKRFSLEQNKALQNCQLLQQKIDNLQQELVISGEERALCLRDIASHSGRSSELECEVKMLESERDRLQQELSRAQQVEYRLKENLEKLEQETQKLKQMGIEAEESEERFSLEQRRALGNCQLLQQKIVNLQQELEISGEERALYLRDLATHSNRSSELECEVKRLESERDCLQHELSRARQVEDRLKENLEKLEQETQNLSKTLDSQGKKMAGQQEELRCLELEVSCVRNEQKIVIEKKDLLVDEKRILEQNLKEREQQLEEAREKFLRLETNYNELQQVTASINIDFGSKVKEARIVDEYMIIWQALKSELEYKLNQWSRQALQEDKENVLEEMLSVAQQKIMELEQHIVNGQKRMIETSEDCRRQGEDIPALMQELAAVSVAKQDWEKKAAKLKGDKLAYRYELEKLKQELKCIEDQKEQSDFASETAILRRPEGLATLLSLQEQIQSTADLKLELDGRYFKLTAEWGAAEKKLHDMIAEQKWANGEKRNDMLPNHKHVLEVEDKVCHLSLKEDIINDDASGENPLKDLQGHLVELEFQLSEHQYTNFSVQADAQERIIEAGEELKLHSKDIDDLKQEVAVVNTAKNELEKDLAKLQEDRAACSCKFEKELKHMQGQKETSDLALEGANVQRSEEEELRQLKMVFLGEEIQKKAEIANEGVTVIQRMLHDLQQNLVILEENVRGLKVQLEMKIGQNKSLLCFLTDLQMKDFPLASLKKKFLLLCKALMIVANDWNEKAYDNKNTQIIKGVEKLGRVEALCMDIDVPADDKRICLDYGTNPASDPTFECNCMLHQLQKRTKEVSLLYDAVEAMLPPSTSKDSKDIIPGNENDESPLHQGQRTKDIGREEVDSIPDGLMHKGMEIMINESKDAEKEVELFEGLAQLHINLGMRLHQALMDEKLENQLKELKEEREKLKDDLQIRVEQVQRMEEELEKLQGFLNGEEGEMADPKQQQQLLLYKKRAEKRARRLSRELVLQRDEVRSLQNSLLTWTEQQELATEVLEKRIFDLVSKECSPDMEGWDADQVVHLMQELHSHKAITRRHSMDLQSVGQQLQKVGSSIESTQRQLLEGARAQDEKANDDGLSSNTLPQNAASELMHSHHRVRRFGLAWLLLLWRQSFSEGSPKDRIASSKHSPQQHIRRATVLNSLMAHTRKIRCCACGSGSHDGLHSIHGKG